jgi:hypothetical protein
MPNGRLLVGERDDTDGGQLRFEQGRGELVFEGNTVTLKIDGRTVFERDVKIGMMRNIDYLDGGRHDCLYRATIDEGPIAIGIVDFDTNPISAKDTSWLEKSLGELDDL